MGDEEGCVDSPAVWIPLSVLFLAPFVDPSRPGRILHLDLLVLLCFGGYPLLAGGSPVLAYAGLAYVLVRLLQAALSPARRDDALVPHVPIAWLGAGLVVLIGIRIGINLNEAYVIDTGRSSLIGAERILDGVDLYSAGPHYDTYGPLNYLAYLPFAAVFGGDPAAADPAAAHAAAISFDLGVIAILLLLGPRLWGGRSGRRLGVILAYAWAAYPYSLFVLAHNTNDALFTGLLLLALLGLASPGRRGAALAAATAVKLGSLALTPLMATEPGRRGRRPAPAFVLAFAAVLGVGFLPFVPDGGFGELYDRTIGFQLGAGTMFGVWEMRPAAVQAALQLGALGLGVAVAFFPRRRDAVQVAALAGAVLVAVQLAAQHWSYFYIAWFAPFALIALFGGYRVAGGEDLPLSSATSTNGNAQGRYAQVQ